MLYHTHPSFVWSALLDAQPYSQPLPPSQDLTGPHRNFSNFSISGAFTFPLSLSTFHISVRNGIIHNTPGYTAFRHLLSLTTILARRYILSRTAYNTAYVGSGGSAYDDMQLFRTRLLHHSGVPSLS